MLPKRIICGAGEKGGTGKSSLCSVATDYALRVGCAPFLVEGDPSIPDVAERYRGYLDGLEVPLQRPDSAGQAVVELFSALEEIFTAVDTVVLNLPAGAAATVDRMAEELIGPTLEALEVELVTCFLLGPGEESVRALAESWESGLCAISTTAIAVPNAFFGAAEGFPWHRSQLRNQWLENGRHEFVFPKLIPRVADRVRDLPGPYHLLASGEAGDLTVVERAALRAWLRSCEPVCRLAMGESSDGTTAVEDQVA